MDEKKKPDTDTAMGTLALWEETAEHSLAPHLAYWLRYNIGGRAPKSASETKRLLDERAALLSVLEAAQRITLEKDIEDPDNFGEERIVDCRILHHDRLREAIAKARAKLGGGE